jgi:hypothetical protein
LEEKAFYGIFLYMLKKIKKGNETLMTWKKYEGNQCKIIVIFKI